ncbi:hypothetical protein QBC42DRAFT_299412 [Cladorrhinum samala]|uniref:ubiquitinyl hydrolase 1 n=1 Tax=Cladorrhinum samala TaxID=585594 RepID=A0AAV9HG69_9PEZI|nr:hypothetical protein QBC42DRAFT_299412 [Cladorrhinum samala]
MAIDLPASNGVRLDGPTIDFIIHHVFLPPRLPQEDDTNSQHLLSMTQVLRDSISGFMEAEHRSSPSLQPALEMLGRFLETNPGLGLSQTGIAQRDALRSVISNLKAGDVALLRLRSQNAGLLLTGKSDSILFETFELLAPNRNVMSCKGALRREFPDRAVIVPFGKLEEAELLDELVHAIQVLDSEVAPGARHKVTKAKTMQPEERDTLSPIFVTGLLTDILVGLGREVHPVRIIKRSREQVCFSNAFLPFHRSPNWLLLRVALRLVLDRLAVMNCEESWYKPLMAYHHARILGLARQSTKFSVPSDQLSSMKAKLVRRIVKLDPAEGEYSGWLKEVWEIVVQSQETLMDRWVVARGKHDKFLPLHRLSEVSFCSDSRLKLEGLGEHLSWIESRDTARRNDTEEGDITRFHTLSSTELPSLSAAMPEDAVAGRCELVDFEAWVESSLPGWSERNHFRADEAVEAVDKLRSLINAYYTRASTTYDGIPGALSVMYMIIVELWIVLDKIAGKEIPLILDYNPGFPANLFHPLLLERKEEMDRLCAVENYLSSRMARARGCYESAFTGFGRDESFAVRFYQTSAHHQRIRENIDAWATKMEAEKLEEYNKKEAEYSSKLATFNATSCEYYWNERWEEQTHSSSCTRCRLQQEMADLKIEVFERPLPSRSSDADAAVFEISVPRVVVIWRDVTWKLITEVFRDQKERGRDGSGQSLYFAAERRGMGRFLETASRQRPASTVKPMEVAHYRVKHIREANPGNICVPHAAQYTYYDHPSMTPTETRISGACIPRHCSYAELVAREDPIQDWIRYTNHTSNDIIAAQHRCPLDVTLSEFRELGNLRSGVSLQWSNILCQLVIPSVDFNKKQTLALILQACLEVGPRLDSAYDGWTDPARREAHFDTQKQSFMSRMISAMNDALERIRGSWQNDIALCILTCLATRLLSLSPSPDISSALLRYLGQLREVSIGWARLLLKKLNDSDKISDRERWIERLLLASLICATTFDMEVDHLEPVLEDSDSISLLVESAVLARNHLPPSGKPVDSIALQLMQRWHLIMYRTRHLVTKQVLEKGNQGLDSAIKKLWADYSPPSSSSPGWTQLDRNTRSHILTRKSGPVSITFNLLTGNMFLDGRPLSKLPSSYQKHQTFNQLFGQQILDVGPSSVTGMEFSASRPQNGWVIHFAMKDGRLVVRAVADQNEPGPELWEYIPREHLVKDLPNSFVNDYAHWLNLSTGRVEFRPLAQKWKTTSENWCLTRENGKPMLKKGSLAVVDPSSPTAALCHRILGGIETLRDINVIFDSATKLLSLILPRLSISFQVRQGEIAVRSMNYTGMEIDNRQGINTLVGLADKLVLRPERGPGFRMLLVPRGQVSTQLTDASGHVNVSIHRGSDTRRIHHDAFLIDDKLGCLTDTGSLHSRLYLCWLHALTSHCLPDPLTSRTGTEEALRILRGAAVKSHPNLDHDSRELLVQIAQLSPRRTYYPSHLEDMEQAKWNDDLPPLSQHDDFWPLAKSIYDDYEKSGKLFQLDNREADTNTSAKQVFSTSEEQRSSKLAERARIRNAMFRVAEFGAESHTTGSDAWYHPGDRAATGGSHESRTMVPRLVECMDAGADCLIFKPSTGLSGRIKATNGKMFNGRPKVTIGFDLANLRVPSKVLGGLWCGLHRKLATESNKYKKMFFLSSLLYAEGSDPEVVQALLALGKIAAFGQTNMLPPPDLDFNLKISRNSLLDRFTSATEDGRKQLQGCPEYPGTRRQGESVRSFEDRRHWEWRNNSNAMVSKFVNELKSQVERSWTINIPTGAAYTSYLNVNKIMPQVRGIVEMARRTEAFCTYLTMLSTRMGEIDIMESSEPVSVPSGDPGRKLRSRRGFVSAVSLFSQSTPHSHRPRPSRFSTLHIEAQGSEHPHERLSTLLDGLSANPNLQAFQASYIAELRRSMASPVAPRHGRDLPEGLAENLERARTDHASILRGLQRNLSGSSIAYQVCNDAGVFPRISPVFLLQRLTRSFWGDLSKPWRCYLVYFALSLVYLQRAERLASYASDLPRRREDLQRELANAGDHENEEWDPLEYPESLLLEIEQGIMIRPVQNKVAAAMRSPPGMKNSVMQLNMGEGKSSVIVPIVAAALANGKQLVRVVVAKPQSSQMIHMLISKLGGLINRRVFYLPFSRSVQLSGSDVAVAREIIEKCRVEGGVLLLQPEHLLSFKLMGIDKSWAPENGNEDRGKTNDTSLGADITKLYQDFESVSRDIVDESDENFRVKFELIYTMGAQEPVEMSPKRWILIQQLLSMAESVTRRLIADIAGVADGLLVEDLDSGRVPSGRVPVIRVVDESAGRRLVAELADEVCNRGLTGFPLHHRTPRMRQAMRSYILIDQIAEEDVKLVEDDHAGMFSCPDARDTVLLLRGLLAKGVILFALGQKRFRVNYGLAPDRRPQTMLAVPYRAKDMPSPRSEFSHPDVVIVLTCLSYYYSGLSDEQLYTCLELLQASDEAKQEYGRWAATSPGLPHSFQHFSSINIEDKPQCENIVFPALRYTRAAVDFYLSRVVFPKEMKQFPLKLASSGWDLAKPKKNPLTGFSGTNDSKEVLPLSVTALDLQPHTNAAVLSTLLGDENTVLEIEAGHGSPLSALTEGMLLDALRKSDPPMRVVLDVGAQIIESTNLRMAQMLLERVPISSAEAVIFFNDSDELSVLLRNGDVVPFLTSPFAKQTDRCLVYLDQAHTRGTDLKLPSDYRAAVTLGPGVTKDTLVQACMRMRKLGQGQSVTFVVSTEMQKRIRAIRNLGSERRLTVADVIAWAISETWDETVRSVPLWAAQGMRHIRQEAIWRKAEQQGCFSPSNAREYLEAEGMCLEERYRPRPAPTAGGGGSTEIAALMANLDLEDQRDPDETAQTDDTTATQLSAIREKVSAFTHASRTGSTATSSALQEEQERELAPEIEEERQVARPPPRAALSHKLHPDLIYFVRTGRVRPSSPAFSKSFSAMSTASFASLFSPGVDNFPSDLLVTNDFTRTVEETGPRYKSDSYQRGARWVLVSRAKRSGDDEEEVRSDALETMVLISQWEASELKGLIEGMQQNAAESKASGGAPKVPVRVPVTLHAYLPRPSLTFRTMEDLNTYAVPAEAADKDWEPVSPELVMQLNLFAGQLYLRSYDEYKRLCRHLGLAYTANEDEDSAVPPDGFVGRKKYPGCEFDASPVAFLNKVYNDIRRDCMGGIEKTHMGRILAGDMLTEDDFEAKSKLDLGWI